MSKRDLHISNSHGAAANIKDLVLYGDPDAWICIAKASSEAQGFMKSTKAMNVPGLGVLVQVTTMQKELPPAGLVESDEVFHTSEALAFVPDAIINHTVTGPTIQGRHTDRVEMMPYSEEGKCRSDNHHYQVISDRPYTKDSAIGVEYVHAMCIRCGDNIELKAKVVG